MKILVSKETFDLFFSFSPYIFQTLTFRFL